MQVHSVSKEIAGRTLSISTGTLAKLADGSVTVQYGDTVVFGAVARAKPREGIDFFPLQVDYRERRAAAGKFPGGFMKREGRPTALLHPDDAARLGVADGSLLRLGNAQGEITLHARLAGPDSRMQPGTVIVESIWPNEDYPGQLGINVLTSDAPAAPNGGAVFHDTAVWVRAAANARAAEPALLAAE